MLVTGTIERCSREAPPSGRILLTMMQYQVKDLLLLQVDVEIDLEAVRGPLKDWVASEPVQREVIRQFKKFLRTFTDDNGELVYRARIQDMCRGTSRLSILVLLSQKPGLVLS